ncbi:hypothetical protein ACHWQZ_G015911 [Mnemiopsis leidyi]
MQHSALDSGRKISQFAPPLSLTLSLSAGRFGPAIKSDNPIKYRSRFLLYRTLLTMTMREHESFYLEVT